MIQELQDRFGELQVLPPVILKAANGENFQSSLEKLKTSCFQDDFNCDCLE